MYNYRVHTRACTHALHGPTWVSVWDSALVFKLDAALGPSTPAGMPGASGRSVQTLGSGVRPCWVTAAGPAGQVRFCWRSCDQLAGLTVTGRI